MNIAENQREITKVISKIKDVNKICEYLNKNYMKMEGLDIKTFVAIDGIIYQISTVDLARGNEEIADAYSKMYIKRYETIVFKGLCLAHIDFSEELYFKRYKTEEEAIAGHEHILSKIEDIVKLAV